MTLGRIGKYYYIDLRVRGAKKWIRRALHTSDKVDALDKQKEEKEDPDGISSEVSQVRGLRQEISRLGLELEAGLRGVSPQ